MTPTRGMVLQTVVLLGSLWGTTIAPTPARAGDPADPRSHLTQSEAERLARDKVLVAGAEIRQCFEPYISGRVPAFVTSDSVLNAYHVVLEECVARTERVRAARLPAVLRPMWDGLAAAGSRLDVPENLRRDAMLRARVLVGTALRVLTGETPPGAPPDVEELIATEASRVLAATERLRPAWLGGADPGFPFLDYARCRPRGFYDRDPLLSAYFRAVAWLQAVPLRLDREPEVLTALLLATSLRRQSAPDARRRYESFVAAWESLLGRYGDLPLPTDAAPEDADGRWTATDVKALTERCRKAWLDGALVPADPLLGIEPSCRVLPARMLPEGALFDRCCPPSEEPSHPSGLFVAAALGGAFARDEALRGRAPDERTRLAAEFASMSGRLRNDRLGAFRSVEEGPDAPGGLYLRYLSCLAALLDPPDPATPSLFGGDAWQAKSTNTALAAWAQMRHTWALQARESASYGSAESNVAGFVEPNPRFFSRMAELVAATSDLFERLGAFDPALDRRAVARTLEDGAAVLRGPRRDAVLRDLPRDERTAVETAWWFLEYAGLVPGDLGPAAEPKLTTAHLGVLADAVRLLDGEAPLPRAWAEIVGGWSPPLRETWLHLERTCRKIESLAHKQLRGAAWDDDEAGFLRGYGHTLARAMLYFGNSYVSPRDDAPRAASVHAWFGGGRAEFLHAAVARPRLLWVLYPQGDREILCVGSVLPYREFVWEERLTDEAWRKLLVSAEAPAPPPWCDRIAVPVR